MHRVLYVFLPSWPIDRMRRAGLLPSAKNGERPGDHSAGSNIAPPRRKPGRPIPTMGPGFRRDGENGEIPFSTVVAANGRQLLAAVNPAAAAKGLVAGMPLADALSFLPGLTTRPTEPAEDEAALRRLAEWCGRYSPWTAPDGTDGVKIEVTGSAHLWGGEAQLAADLSQRLARQDIAHRIAIADTLGAAWGLARYAASGKAPVIILPDGAFDALAPLPVAALRLDPAIVQSLHRVGLRRIGDIGKMPRDALARRFGEEIGRRLDQALGALPEPLSPLGEVPTRRVRLSFAEPIADPADLARAVERLAQDLVTRLAREGMGARRLDLGFHRVDGRVERIRIGTARPSRDPTHLARLMIGKLDTVDPGLGVEDAILAAFAVEPLVPEQIELPRAAMRSGLDPGAGVRGSHGPDTASLFDRIGARLGLDALARPEARESHIPERASVAVNMADGAFDNPPCPPLGREGFIAPAKPPRPVRLFAPPEPVEAFWVLPDDPPFRFTWRRRLHRVAQADGPERIAEEWWQPNEQMTGGRLADSPGDPPWSLGAIRDYYRVEDEAGRRYWLFRAGLPGDPPPRWFVHGLFA